MSRAEREAVAAYLGTPGGDTPPPPEAFCSDRKVTVPDRSKFVWNGWSPSPENTRFQAADVAGLSISQLQHLKLKWAFGYDGDVTAFAPPTFLDGQIFVGSATAEPFTPCARRYGLSAMGFSGQWAGALRNPSGSHGQAAFAFIR